LEKIFHYDRRDEIEPNLDPIPYPRYWPTTLGGLHKLQMHLNPDEPSRIPYEWHENISDWKKRDYPLLLRLHQGFFLTLGVGGWKRFAEVLRLTSDSPEYVHAAMNYQGEFVACLVERLLKEIKVDAVIFSEPIGGNHGPLISPSMYKNFVLSSFNPIIDVLRVHQVGYIILRTWANVRVLLPDAVKAGFNVLWAHETNLDAMDYQHIRNEFGNDLALIGGIDTDLLSTNPEMIREEIIKKVPPLLEGGGFIPLADGRVREYVPWENYYTYRQTLENLLGLS
jgi:uroporphyrinogen decarboxylase